MATVRVWLHSFMYESCSVTCHYLMTTYRAWLFIHTVFNMLCQLSSSHNNGQSTTALLFLRVVRIFCDFVESYKCGWLPHVCLAAAVQLMLFSFPTVQLICPVRIFAKVSVCDLSKSISKTKKYRQTVAGLM